tara:strand:+ start:6878 stop:7240 length:363 start_codon:yes stop_codon:yes gene_type:complete
MFSITDWQETTEKTFEQGSKLNIAKVRQHYTGELTGTSEVFYHMHYDAAGNASFSGFEYIDGVIDNQACRLVISHTGSFQQGIASSHFTIIECDTTKALEGQTGYFTSGEGGKADYVIGE